MPKKLTTAQAAFLQRLETWGPGPADPRYGPALALLKAGYATKEVRRNKMRLHIFTITPAGRAALAALAPDDVGSPSLSGDAK